MKIAQLPPPAKILIVEDDRNVYHPISLLLAHYEYDVQIATTLVEGDAAMSLNPAIIILDLHLPDGNGLKLLEKVRSENCKSKVFVLSADSRPEIHRILRRFVPDQVFTKPFNFYAILDAIRNATLEEQGASKPPNWLAA